MAQVGSVSILVKLMGGAEVLRELQQIRQTADQIAAKPITIKTNLDKVVTEQEKAAQAAAKTALAQQRLATEAARTETAETNAAAAAEKLAAASAKAQQAQLNLNKATTNAADAAQRKADTEAAKIERQQATYQRAVQQQAAGFARAMDDIASEQQAKLIARNQMFQTGLSVVANGLNRISGLWDRGLQGIMRFSDGMVHAGQVAATFAYRLTLIAAPIDILIAKSLQFSIQLESALAKVATQLDGTVEHMRGFIGESRDMILGLQSQYGVAGSQQADALYYLISSGVQEEQAQAALAPLTKLAAVTQSNAGIASQALVAALNVFQEQLSKIPDYADRATYALEVMFDATTKGRFEFEDFAQQFGRAAEPMRLVGATLEDTAAALATLSQVFTPSQAATTLASFASAILNPTKEAKDALDELYGDWHDFAYKMGADGQLVKKNFDDVITDFFARVREIAKKDLPKADEILTSVFGGQRGGRGAAFLLDPANLDLFKNIKAQLGTDDSIGKAWQITSEQIQTQLNILQGKFLSFGTVITDTMKPALLGGIEALKALFDALAKNPQVVQLLAGIGAAMAVIAPASLVLGTALMGAGGFVTALGVLMSPPYLIGFSIVMQALAPTLQTASAAIKEFGGGLTGILGLVVETAHQLGILSETDVKNIFDKMGVTVTPEAITRVRDFVTSLNQLGDDARSIADGIGKIVEAITTLIDRIGKGEGLLGRFATVASQFGGVAANFFGGGTSGDLAGKFDLIIGSALLAKFGGILLGALSKLNAAVMNVTAGQVNLLGASSAGGILGAGSSLVIPVAIVSIAAAVVGALAEANTQRTGKDWRSAGLGGGTNPMNGEVVGGWYASGIVESALEQLFYVIDQATRRMQEAQRWEKFGGLNSWGAMQQDSLGDPRAYDNPLSSIALDSISATAASALGSVATAAINAANGLSQIPAAIREFSSNFLSEFSQWASNMRAMFIPNYGANFMPTTPEGYGDYARSAGLQSRLESQYGDLINYGKQQFEKNVIAPLNSVGSAATKTASALETAAQKIVDTIKSLVKDALAATKVTDEDVAAAAAGTYKDKADEFARRARAVATGTNPEQYGAQFQEQYALAQKKMPGASGEEIANAFEDRSLFAGMTTEEIEKMWNWDAIVASVKAGIARIVGEFKLMKTAVAEVIQNLSKEDLQGLAEALGVDANADALTGAVMQKLNGVTQQKVKTDISANFGKDDAAFKMVKQYVDWIQQIPKSIVTEIGLELAKDFEDVANTIIKFLNSIPTQINVAINVGTNISGGASGYLGIEPFHAPVAGGGGGGGHPKAAGGYVYNGLYRVGEQGKEYVLPHGITSLLESMLGGQINMPSDILGLIYGRQRGFTGGDAIGRGPTRDAQGRWIRIENAYFQVAEGTTLELLAAQIRNYAAHGYD